MGEIPEKSSLSDSEQRVRDAMDEIGDDTESIREAAARLPKEKRLHSFNVDRQQELIEAGVGDVDIEEAMRATDRIIQKEADEGSQSEEPS